MKTLVILLLVLLCLLPATQSLAQQTDFLDRFMDNKRKGLWAGAELGYAVGAVQYSIPLLDFEDTSEIQGTLIRGKLGYAPSENLVPYIAGGTDALDFGAMVFLPNIRPGFYLDGSFGSYDLDLEESDSNFYGLRFCGGYEFQPHWSIEAGMRYIWGSASILGEIRTDVSARIFFISINYLAY